MDLWGPGADPHSVGSMTLVPRFSPHIDIGKTSPSMAVSTLFPFLLKVGYLTFTVLAGIRAQY